MGFAPARHVPSEFLARSRRRRTGRKSAEAVCMTYDTQWRDLCDMIHIRGQSRINADRIISHMYIRIWLLGFTGSVFLPKRNVAGTTRTGSRRPAFAFTLRPKLPRWRWCADRLHATPPPSGATLQFQPASLLLTIWVAEGWLARGHRGRALGIRGDDRFRAASGVRVGFALAPSP